MRPGQQNIFLSLMASVFVATTLASLVALDMYEAAKVSTQVKSQTTYQPDFHGAMEQPLGYLPSDLHKPVGSRFDGKLLTAASDLCMMAFIAACREK